MSEYKRKISSADVDEAQISEKMTHAIHEAMGKYDDIDDFYVAVEAIKKSGGEYVVLKYRNDQISAYQEKHVQGFQKTINDSLVFEKKTIQERDDDQKRVTKTGWFYPISFWEHIARTRPRKFIPADEYFAMRNRIDEKLKYMVNFTKNN
jgi:hypothetical protein